MSISCKLNCTFYECTRLSIPMSSHDFTIHQTIHTRPKPCPLMTSLNLQLLMPMQLRTSVLSIVFTVLYSDCLEVEYCPFMQVLTLPLLLHTLPYRLPQLSVTTLLLYRTDYRNHPLLLCCFTTHRLPQLELYRPLTEPLPYSHQNIPFHPQNIPLTATKVPKYISVQVSPYQLYYPLYCTSCVPSWHLYRSCGAREIISVKSDVNKSPDFSL